jgi:hypothetical protein
MLARLVAVLAVVAALAPRADAQLTDIQVYQRVQAGVTAVDMNSPQYSDGIDVPGTTSPALSNGGEITYTYEVTSGNAAATTSLTIDYLDSSSSLSGTATFHSEADGNSPAASMANVDVGFGFVFGATAVTAFHVSGLVQTSQPLQDLSDFLQCQLNGTVLAGYPASSIPLNTPVTFDHDATISPGETFQLECRATRGVSNGLGPETQDLQFSFALELTGGSTPTTTTPTATATTTTLPLQLTKKQCRRACNVAAKACRQSCAAAGTGPQRRACKKTCKQARKHCNQSTGCALPPS